ncbi:hypothetical protein BT69DRAFT_61127 [Atractiella rhizophila]|nr:hypothetical protein BT69DRAFT_61127 [Atractiella rhizophila]
MSEETPLAFNSPCGANCSFSLDFYAPSISCSLQEWWQFDNTDATQAAPSENQLAFNSSVEVMKKPYVQRYPGTTLQPGRKIWLQYLNYTTDPVTKQGLDPANVCNFKRDIFLGDPCQVTLQCSPFNASYQVSVSFNNGIPHWEVVTSRINDFPQLQADLDPLPNGSDNTWWPFLGLVDEFYSFLEGNVTTDDTTVVDSKILDTVLATVIPINITDILQDGSQTRGGEIWILDHNLPSAIPSLLANLTLSTLSTNMATLTTICEMSQSQTVFQYRPIGLLVSYAVALMVTLICGILGVSALASNGVPTGKTFSQILVTTRGSPTLDALSKGHSTGSEGAKSLEKERVKFGELRQSFAADGRKAGFGVEGEVEPLQRRAVYDG